MTDADRAALDLPAGLFDEPEPELPPGVRLGESREGRPIRGYRFGSGTERVSLIAGCHADEPVGPRLLARLVALMASIGPEHPLLRDREWWIVPHANPDGRGRNRSWQVDGTEVYGLASYLLGAVREFPGDDVEFGFPRGEGDTGARPENRALHRWWSSAKGPFLAHCSLHGMAFAAGPWFLVEPAWVDRIDPLRAEVGRAVHEMGYRLHDVEREGEKGFVRIAPGFCTRPDSAAMKRFFLERGDEETAGRFRPSSMETIRSLGGDPITLVTEMPLFLTPGVGRELGPPDPVARRWSERVGDWRARLEDGEAPGVIEREARDVGLRPMSVRDQMVIQWGFIASAISLARELRSD